MPVHGDHYVATLDQRYPDLAYEPFPEGGGRGRWKWDGKRPRYIGEEFFAHRSVDHSAGEYVRDGFKHSNTAESYFAILKRGVYGSFHSISETHLQRYLVEFDFRWNTRKISDVERAERLLTGAKGKRLMYRQPDQSAYA